MAQNKWPLPIEITKRIIELACWPDGPRGGYNSRQLVTYAGVSREWRDLVERHTFRNLRLDRARLADVNRIVCRRRRAHVRTVSLDVELEPYGRDVYGAFETAEEIARHSAIFRRCGCSSTSSAGGHLQATASMAMGRAPSRPAYGSASKPSRPATWTVVARQR